MTLTAYELQHALDDERHLGFGYATADCLKPAQRAALDEELLAVANELDLTAEQLFHWTNSKYGRWLVDDASGRTPSEITRAKVRMFLHTEAVDAAVPTEKGDR